MSETVIVSLINTCGLVAVAIIGQGLLRRVRRVERDTKATREQVENNHDTNLREEADERHAENKTTLDEIAGTVGGLNRMFRQFRREVRDEFARLRGDDADQRDRIHDLEKTIPKGLRHERPEPHPEPLDPHPWPGPREGGDDGP